MLEYCPKCKSEESVKNGNINVRPRYRCKSCKYDYTVMQKATSFRDVFRRNGALIQ